MLGPALAPVCGGLAAHYTSWRDMQYALGICGVIAFAAVAAFLPETAHPMTRGVDKLPQFLNGFEQQRHKLIGVNPLASLWLLRSPNLLAVVGVTVAAGTAVTLILPFNRRASRAPSHYSQIIVSRTQTQLSNIIYRVGPTVLLILLAYTIVSF
jgi:MFS family permease